MATKRNKMDKMLTILPIAYIESDFPEKFGIPRQSGLVEELRAKIIFEDKYKNSSALKYIEGYNYLWLIWGFSAEEKTDEWSPTVRPPRLGGNTRVGVFASRSPNRPNPIGLSSVKLLSVNNDGSISIGGADLMDGTPIYDIKPYLPSVDMHSDAKGGFSAEINDYRLSVIIPNNLKTILSAEKMKALEGVLSEDPRPAYQTDDRTYKMSFAGCTISFQVKGKVLTVTEIR